MTGSEIKSKLLKAGITPKTVLHRNRNWIALAFDYNVKLNAAIKNTEGSRWSKTLNCWLIPKKTELLESFISQIETATREQLTDIPQWMNDYVRQLRIRNYSPATEKSYISIVLAFYYYHNGRQTERITQTEIEQYLEYLATEKKISASALNVTLNAIKFLFEQVWRKPRTVYAIKRAMKPQQLPAVFGESDVKKILNVLENLKHKTILCLAYAAGLRVSEITNIKIADVDSSRMVITIRQGKGRKDRQVMLSEKLLTLLREYFKEYKPKLWLFEGQYGEQYTTRSIQILLHMAKEKAGVNKKGSIHALRHSFATHLMEGGTDIMAIKELLGHNSIRTTMRYTHVSKKHIAKIQSPLDKLL